VYDRTSDGDSLSWSLALACRGMPPLAHVLNAAAPVVLVLAAACGEAPSRGNATTGRTVGNRPANRDSGDSCRCKCPSGSVGTSARRNSRSRFDRGCAVGG
jgi:hypothetical protein